MVNGAVCVCSNVGDVGTGCCASIDGLLCETFEHISCCLTDFILKTYMIGSIKGFSIIRYVHIARTLSWSDWFPMAKLTIETNGLGLIIKAETRTIK